jgi:hypothetical protein
MSHYQLFSKPEIVKTIKIGRLRWAGVLCECWMMNLLKKLSLIKPDGCRRVGRPKFRWMDGIEDDHRMLCVRRW